MKKQTQIVACPACSHKFAVSQALESAMETRLRKKWDAEQVAWQEKQRVLIERRLKLELTNQVSVRIDDLQEALSEKEKALKEARKSELEVRRKIREMSEKTEAFELEKQRIIDGEIKQISRLADERAEEKLKLKIQEKDIQLKSLAAKIDELKKKSEKTSQELQGTAQEVELLHVLQKNFPEDILERAGKGQRGCDIFHSVNFTGKMCGKIVWESKRTANWSNAWIDTLRNNRNSEKADIAILVSQTLPGSISNAGCIDGIWVCDFRTAPVLASALRNGLIEIAGVRSALENRSDMKDVVWRYLTGNDFKQRIERILRKFMIMKTQIDKERTSTLKWLAERDQQLNLIAEDVNGLRGEVEAMIQTSLVKEAQLSLAVR